MATSDSEDEAAPKVAGTIYFYDAAGRIAELYGVSYEIGAPISFLLSPRLQVFGIVASGTPEERVTTIAAAGMPSCRIPG